MRPCRQRFLENATTCILTGFVVALILLSSTTAEAYIGPGAGAGTIAVVVGVIASVFMAFVALLWYPFKRLMKNRKAARQTTATTERSETS